MRIATLPGLLVRFRSADSLENRLVEKNSGQDHTAEQVQAVLQRTKEELNQARLAMDTAPTWPEKISRATQGFNQVVMGALDFFRTLRNEKTSPLYHWAKSSSHHLTNMAQGVDSALRMATEFTPASAESEAEQYLDIRFTEVQRAIETYNQHLQKGVTAREDHVTSVLGKVLETSQGEISLKQLQLGLSLQEDVNWDTLHAKMPDFNLFDTMNNLVQNAVKYTPEGGRIDISMRIAGNNLVFEVTDTGRGIAPEEMATVLNGNRAPSVIAEGIFGTGTGLKLVRYHLPSDDDLTLKSPVRPDGPNPGTRVTCRIPLQPLSPEKETSIRASSTGAPEKGVVAIKAAPEISSEQVQTLFQSAREKLLQSIQAMADTPELTDKISLAQTTYDQVIKPIYIHLDAIQKTSPLFHWAASVQHDLSNITCTLSSNINQASKPNIERYVSDATIKNNEDFFKVQVEPAFQRIANMLKTYTSHLQKGLQTSQQDAMAVLNDTLGDLHGSIDAKHLSLGLSLQEDVNWRQIQAKIPDFDWFNIVTNTLQNAIKYTPEGGRIDVSLRIAEEAGPKKRLVFEVTDTGIGIPPEEIKKVLDGGRASNAIASGIFGTGTGLKLLTPRWFDPDYFQLKSPVRPEGSDSPGTRVTYRIPLKKEPV